MSVRSAGEHVGASGYFVAASSFEKGYGFAVETDDGGSFIVEGHHPGSLGTHGLLDF